MAATQRSRLSPQPCHWKALCPCRKSPISLGPKCWHFLKMSWPQLFLYSLLWLFNSLATEVESPRLDPHPARVPACAHHSPLFLCRSKVSLSSWNCKNGKLQFCHEGAFKKYSFPEVAKPRQLRVSQTWLELSQTCSFPGHQRPYVQPHRTIGRAKRCSG